MRGHILTADNGTKRLPAGTYTGLNAKGFYVAESAVLAAVDGNNGKSGASAATVDFTDSDNFNIAGATLSTQEEHFVKSQDGVDFVITDIEVTSGVIVIF